MYTFSLILVKTEELECRVCNGRDPFGGVGACKDENDNGEIKKCAKGDIFCAKAVSTVQGEQFLRIICESPANLWIIETLLKKDRL